MRPVCLLVALLAITATAANAGEALTPVSEKALHFRLEVGVEPGHVVTGWLDVRAAGKTEFDCVVLDLDADGAAETVQTFPEPAPAKPGVRVPPPARTITIPHEGANWSVDLRYSRFTPRGEAAETYLRWTVTKGGFYAWFINGKVLFHKTAAAAAKAKSIRLGPPFRFETGTGVRGRDALVNVGLKDGNGCTMRLARMDGKQRQIRMRMVQGEESRYETWATYG